MTIEFQLNENDFLTHQLYISSKSNRIRRRRQRSKIIVAIIYLGIGLLSFLQGEYPFAIICTIVGILWFFLYPIWERGYYIRHFKGFINEHLKSRFDRMGIVEIGNEYITAKDPNSETKVMTSEVEEMIEIPSTIFIRIKGGQSFILPKDRISNIDAVRDRLKELATFLNVKYKLEDDWAWK